MRTRLGGERGERGVQGEDKGKRESARRPASFHHTVQWFLRTFPKSLNSWMSWCYFVTCGSAETDGGAEPSSQIGQGGADSAQEGRGSKQRG